MRRVLRLCGGAPRVLVHLHRLFEIWEVPRHDTTRYRCGIRPGYGSLQMDTALFCPKCRRNERESKERTCHWLQSFVRQLRQVWPLRSSVTGFKFPFDVEVEIEIFAGAFPKNYEPPEGFYFEINDDSPIVQDNIKLFDYNVQERVNDFVAAALSQANITRTNHIMWTMGTDFKYQYAQTWFRNLDKLIHYVNQDGRVNALYSTPSIYTDAKYRENESWPLKTDDFFPYADRVNAYWTGYFTSRPSLKRYVRVMSGYYLLARQLEFFRGRNKIGPTTDTLADALAIAQHHDAVTGTEKQHVADDYATRLSIGYKESEELVAASLACMVESTSKSGCRSPLTKFQQANDNNPICFIVGCVCFVFRLTCITINLSVFFINVPPKYLSLVQALKFKVIQIDCADACTP